MQNPHSLGACPENLQGKPGKPNFLQEGTQCPRHTPQGYMPSAHTVLLDLKIISLYSSTWRKSAVELAIAETCIAYLECLINRTEATNRPESPIKIRPTVPYQSGTSTVAPCTSLVKAEKWFSRLRQRLLHSFSHCRNSIRPLRQAAHHHDLWQI